MSKSSIGLELSDYFNNDDSNGDRLAEYLQKRRGGIQCHKFLFGESEPLRLSVGVQLEKIPNGEQNKNDQPREEAQVVECQAENVNVTAADRSKDEKQKAVEDYAVVGETTSLNKDQQLNPRISAIRKSGGVSPSDRLRRYSLKRNSRMVNGRRTLLKEFESTMTSCEFSPKVCSTPLSQTVLADKPETAANPTGNAENIAPNSTQVNNTPNVPLIDGNFSWSASCAKTSEDKNGSFQQMMESIVETTLKRVQSQNKANLEISKTFEKEPDKSSNACRTYTLEKGNKPGQVILTPNVALSANSSAMDISGTVHQSCHRGSSFAATGTPDNGKNCIHFTHQTLERSRCSRNCEQSGIPNTTRMERERSSAYVGNEGYNLCNAKDLSDMDITALKTHVNQNATLKSGSISETSHNNVHLNPQRTTTHTRVTICFDSPQKTNLSKTENIKMNPRGNRCSVSLRKLKRPGEKTLSEASGNKVTTTSQEMDCNETKIVFGENGIDRTLYDEELVIPETQELPLAVVQSTKQTSIVVSPASQTMRNDDCSPCRPSYASNVPNKSVCSPLKSPVVDHNQETDNLKLSDILTEDEDDLNQNTMLQASATGILGALNLVERKNISQRLRTRYPSRRRVEKAVAEDMLNKTQVQPLQLSLSYQSANRKRSPKRLKIPLNKAPGAALNGEEFAKELARMSNYEIIDLRKKNSMGKVFAIPGRKSTLEREEAVMKQVKLDAEIEMELLRRNKELAEAAVMKQVNVDAEIEMELLRRNKESAEAAVNSEVEKALAEMNKEADKNESATVYLPAPQEFCDKTLPQRQTSPVSESSLADERPCDKVSFRTKKVSLRQNKMKSVPDVLQNYLEVSKKFTKSKKRRRSTINTSKRLLYSHGRSESEETDLNSSNEKRTMHSDTQISLPCVPSPPRSETEQMAELRVVSPPPPLSMSLKNLQNIGAGTTVETPEIQSVTLLPHIPPPPNFESDPGVGTCNLSQGQVHAVEHQIDDHIFKVPLPPPPSKKKRKGKAVVSVKVDTVASNSETAITEMSVSDKTEEGSLRRSKRGHTPAKFPVSLFQLMLQKVLTNKQKAKEKRILRNKQTQREIAKANKKEKTMLKNNSSASSAEPTILRRQKRKPVPVVSERTIPDSSTEQNSLPARGKKNTAEERPTKVSRKAKVRKNEKPECNHLALPTAPPLDHFNNVFDQLRNSGEVDERTLVQEKHNSPVKFSVKKLRVRVARSKTIDKMNEKDVCAPSSTSRSTQLMTSENNSTVSTVTNDSKQQSNFELISWLKNISVAESSKSNDAIFKEMRISSASNLSFTELQGIEYAFYDTDEQASLGYLRFKPRQIKPRKRAKRYNLHFVALVGNFRITANDKQSLVGPGDMVAINKSVYYDIENMFDDISILMVIKK